MDILYQIMNWIYETNDSFELMIGVWDLAENNWYAVIKAEGDGFLIGESSYGAASIDEALHQLWSEIRELEERAKPK